MDFSPHPRPASRDGRPFAMARLFLLVAFLAIPARCDEAPARPRLQIINGSGQAVDLFWLKPGVERVPNGSIPPGGDTIFTTTLGHRFLIVGRDDGAEAAVECLVPVQAFRFDPRGADGIPAFYTQIERLRGFPIVASAKVNPYALKEAAHICDLMLRNRPDVLEAMVKSGARLCIMAHDEYTTDLPEFVRLGTRPMEGFEEFSGKDYWDTRARGTGGSLVDPYCTCAEENVLGYPGDPYEKENILIHEFAHNIHLRGLVNVDPTFDRRLKETYDAAMKAGLWKGKYASVNHHEYFAEGVQSWFDNNRENDHDHNHVNTRAELIEYDPGLAAICREVFGDTGIKYTKPATRLHGHMAGYDPAKAPAFVWPERLMEVREAIRAKAQARSDAGGRQTRDVSGWTLHIDRTLLAAHAAETEKAVTLLRGQLDEIVRAVPAAAVAELRKVPLWFSPAYPDTRPRAEYHPGADWLRRHGRDVAMEKAVEFTNISIFEAESRRMPNFALHELAHAYHDRVLGFDEPRIITAYEKAKASGTYDKVARRDAEGRISHGPAYAMTDHKEYFAEGTEAYFSRNDFFPFTREELERHDPGLAALLEEIWNPAE